MAKMFELNINTEVVAKMAEMAALETEGVVDLGTKPVDIKSVIRRNGGTKSVAVSTDGGIVKIEIYIVVRDGKKVSDIAEKVQEGIKDKIQGMTGKAVTRVNVVVSDIVFDSVKEN